MKKIFLAPLILSFALVFFTGCAPRGETKTLEEILDLAKTRMTKAELDQDGAVPQNVSILKMSLEKALTEVETKPNEAAVLFVEISDSISTLIPHAGITSRAALNELAKQYRELGTNKSVTSDQVKLIVSRTYHAVASELETTKFTL